MSNSLDHTKDFLLGHFDQCLEEHGDTPRGAHWPNEEDRLTRFGVMLDVIPKGVVESVVLCDLACGTGELLRYIRDSEIRNINYVGADLSARALAFARDKFPDTKFVEIDVTDPHAKLDKIACDYLVANGLFTVKWDLSYEQMWRFLESTIRRIWPHVRRGIAFNVMSKIVDWERDDLFHVPMDDLAGLLHELAGRRVRIRADYGLYEYTAFAYRPEPSAES